MLISYIVLDSMGKHVLHMYMHSSSVQTQKALPPKSTQYKTIVKNDVHNYGNGSHLHHHIALKIWKRMFEFCMSSGIKSMGNRMGKGLVRREGEMVCKRMTL